MKVTVIQKDSERYSFVQDAFNDGTPRYCIKRETMMVFGGGISYEYVSKEKGNSLYKELMAKGFHQFRSVREVSWYATRENNTPYAEEWQTDEKYFIPVCARGITYDEDNPVWKRDRTA